MTPTATATATTTAKTTAATSTPDYVSVKRHGLTIKSEELVRPDIAWPTLALFIISLCAFLVLIWIRTQHVLQPDVYSHESQVPYAITVPLTSIAIFILFTPMHDAAHMSISRRYRWMNYLVGRVCAAIFNAPFLAFQNAHLDHHKYTNDPEKDPDYWSGNAPSILMPLRWMTQEYHYYATYLSEPSRLSAYVWFETLTHAITAHAIMVILIWKGYGPLLFWTYVLPLRLAICFLAYSFDYIPHRPHHITRGMDVYATTSRVDGIFMHGDGKEKKWWLDIMLLYQNYHNIHHLYPFLPFYAMAPVWHAHRDELLLLGTPITSMYDSQQPMRWNNQTGKIEAIQAIQEKNVSVSSPNGNAKQGEKHKAA